MMGFPEKFKVSQTDVECYKQFGNSVVVNVLQEFVAEASKDIVKSESDEETTQYERRILLSAI